MAHSHHDHSHEHVRRLSSLNRAFIAGILLNSVFVAAEFTADLHSLGQMIQQGERNMFETMVRFAPPEHLYTIGGDYNVKITPSASSVKPGDTVTLNAVPQQYNPARKTYTDVTGKTYTVSWTVTEGSDVVTLNSRTGSSVTLTAKSGGTATITAETTIDGNKYTGTQKITVTVPAAEDVRLMLEEDATYVMLDGGKLSDAVKKATSTTPSTFSFTLKKADPNEIK